MKSYKNISSEDYPIFFTLIFHIQGHFLSDEIEDKISVLKQRRKVLNDTWYLRQTIYEQNLDTQVCVYLVGCTFHNSIKKKTVI